MELGVCTEKRQDIKLFRCVFDLVTSIDHFLDNSPKIISDLVLTLFTRTLISLPVARRLRTRGVCRADIVFLPGLRVIVLHQLLH